MSHLIVLKFALVLFLTVLSSIIAQTPCPFNENCTCTSTGEISVHCYWNTPTFPIFTEYNSSLIAYVSINITTTGNVSLIPPNAFYPLQTLGSYSKIYFYGTGLVDCKPDGVPLIVSQGAFNLYQQTMIAGLYINNVYMPTIKAGGFANANISEVQFVGAGCMEIVEDHAFDGLSVDLLSFSAANIKMGALSLHGINFWPLSRSYMAFYSSQFTDITPFKQVNSTNLEVEHNFALTYVPDFAFCSCDVLLQCNNSNLQIIFLDNNNISSISINAFANLPSLLLIDLSFNRLTVINESLFANITRLSGLDLSFNSLQSFSPILPTSITELDLSDNQLTDIPTNALNQIPKLQQFSVDGNNITNVPANSFLHLSDLIEVNLDNNPITNIEPGAFNGVIWMHSLEFEGLNELTSVDLLITYGMSNLESLTFIICNNLQAIYLSDAAKLPTKLNAIQLSHLDSLNFIDSNVEHWLQKSPDNVLYLNFDNILCTTDIQWMAVYTICYNQINASTTVCQDGTNLVDYLHTFNPVCNSQ